MSIMPTPTERELEILKILWEMEEASVRDVYERMREAAPIVQNTIQAFLRTMEEKGLVRHRVEGRTFIYRPVELRKQTTRQLTTRFVQQVFDGAIDQLVESVLSHRAPTGEELDRLETLLAEARSTRNRQAGSERRRK
jgi:BlaI family transcriptional regulator, penicillinase repressor